MSNITVKINGNTVTLIVDGRVSEKTFESLAAARACYDKYKAMIDIAAQVAA